MQTLSLAVTPDQFQHDVGWCYVMTIMRMNTPLALTVELQSGLSLPLGQTHKSGLRGTGIRPCYGTAPSLGGSQFRPRETQLRYISGYGQVSSKTGNGAEGSLCLGRET